MGIILPMGISCRWFRLRLSVLSDARSPICTGKCVISLQEASNSMRVLILPISSGKLTSLLLLTINPCKEKAEKLFEVLFDPLLAGRDRPKIWFGRTSAELSDKH